jgi:hypothetical protein
LLSPIKLAEALTLQVALRIVLAESEERTLLRDVLRPDASGGEVALAVGPEGGWTDDESQSFGQAGWISASLGNTILRAETAAMAADCSCGFRAVLTLVLCLISLDSPRILRGADRGGILSRDGCLQVKTCVPLRLFQTIASVKPSTMFTDPCWLSRALARARLRF